ncbi:MAG: hypothetical protein M1833_000268 [Piccolia ochrophora]|nr:MAG: hypothetical protein M1833_000268 [Piccolia ochrophora]
MALLLVLLSSFVALARAQSLFHGTSIIIYPAAHSAYPGNSVFVAANFYSYVTPNGYVSFGWWLPATPSANHSHCSPAPDSYGWYEYTSSGHCSATGCRVHAINYAANDSSTPFIDEDYVATALDLGNGETGKLALSWFDRKGGAYAVGSRKVLSEEGADEGTAGDCRDAFRTLKGIERDRGLPLPFELNDPCLGSGRDTNGNQVVLGVEI